MNIDKPIMIDLIVILHNTNTGDNMQITMYKKTLDEKGELSAIDPSVVFTTGKDAVNHFDSFFNDNQKIKSKVETMVDTIEKLKNVLKQEKNLIVKGIHILTSE